MDEKITITQAQLRQAMLAWETAHRNGETRTYTETSIMPIERVVDESASTLWGFMREAAQ